MNAGYVSVWIILVMVILMATGWRRQLAGDVSMPVMGAAAAGWLILLPYNIQFFSQLTIQMSVIWVIFWSVVPLFRSGGNRVMTLYFIFGIAMIGTLWFWIRKLYFVDPVFIIIHPLWDGPLIAGLLAGLMAARFQDQLFLVTIAVCLGELLLQHSLRQHFPEVRLGGAELWDVYLITLCTARISGTCNIMIAKWKSRFGLGEIS